MKKAVLWMMSISFVLLGLIGVNTTMSLNHEDVMRERGRIFRETNEHLILLFSSLKDVETGMRGYALTRQPSFLEPYEQALPQIEAHKLALKTLLYDKPQYQQLPDLFSLVDQRIAQARLVIQLVQDDGVSKGLAQIKKMEGQCLMDLARQRIDQMQAFEAKSFQDMRQTMADDRNRQRWIFGLEFFLIVLLQVEMLRRIQKEIHQRDTAQSALRTLNLSLEAQVSEQTAELSKLNATLEQRIQERTQKLETLNKELEAFGYAVSHDLRAPLRSISGFGQALLNTKAALLDDEGQDYLSRILNNAQRMGTLIDDLLKLSQLTRTDLNKESVNVSKLARGLVQELQYLHPQRTVKIMIEDNLMVHADKRLMEVALRNLIGNAWKYTQHKDNAEIRVGQTVHRGKPAMYVQDNGAGFDMKYAHKLFGPFQRLHAMEEFSGNGIGLTTVQRIINRHGGEIWTEAALNQGATFYFMV